MKNKWIAFMAMTLMTTLVALTMTFAAAAQKKNDPSRQPQQNPPVIQQLPGKVTLACSPGGGKDVSTPLYVKNPTGQDVPVGTVISWSAKKGAGTATGKETTTQVLQKNNGNQISLLGPPDNIASCQAWYYKK